MQSISWIVYQADFVLSAIRQIKLYNFISLFEAVFLTHHSLGYQHPHSHVWVEWSHPRVHWSSCCHRSCEGYHYWYSQECSGHLQTMICSSGSVWNSPPFGLSYNYHYSAVYWVCMCVYMGMEVSRTYCEGMESYRKEGNHWQACM